MGTIPLDTIYLKQEIAEHLNHEDTVVDEDHPGHYFGARYKFDSVEALFNDEEVQELALDSEDSQEALAGLA